MPRSSSRHLFTALATAATLVLGAATLGAAQAVAAPDDRGPRPAPSARPEVSVIPKPAQLRTVPGGSATLTARTVFLVDDEPGVADVVETFVTDWRTTTGLPLPIKPQGTPRGGSAIEVSIDPGAGLGEEGYRLTVGASRVRVVGGTPEGVFRAMTTLQQLLPPQIESPTRVQATWSIPAVEISDAPRYAFRAGMLDVARRFYEVDDVKRFIDHLAAYKLNVLHLHLTDDQGWRLTVPSRPKLTEIGGQTQSGWAPGTGGPWFYTQEDYREILDYAAERFVEVMPEIDGPSHAMAAKAAYPELNCDGQSIPPYYGFAVGLPTICLAESARATTRAYLQDVLTEAARQSTSDYVHIGGDEVPSTTDEQMDWYVRTASDAVTAAGKKVMGWSQIGVGSLPPGTLLQWWGTASDKRSIGTANETAYITDLRNGLAQGAKVVASPADRSYLDMKYDASVPWGLSWAGLVNLRRAYEWEPVGELTGPTGVSVVTEDQVAGVEAALWADRAYRGSTSLPTSLSQFPPPSVYADHVTFPRLPAIAEIAWSPKEGRSYDEFVERVIDHAPRWDAAGIGFYRAPDIPWE